MKRIALLLVVLAACGGDSGTATTSSTTTTAATTTTTAATDTTAGSDTTAAEVTTTSAPTTGTLGLYSIMFTAGTVVLFNGSNTDADLAGFALCQEATCAGIPDVTLPAGQYLSINVGADFFFPIPGSLSIDEALDIGGIDPSGGEVALLDAGAQVVSFVAWASAPIEGYYDLAVAAGVWPDGSLVDTTAETTAITYLPDSSTSDESGWSSF